MRGTSRKLEPAPRKPAVEGVISRGARLLRAVLSASLAVACAQEIERVPEPYRPTTAHEAYGHALGEARLSGSALGRDWIEAAERAIAAPVEITSPFRETGYFDAARADAVGYAFSVEGGQRIEVEVEIESSKPMRLFLDMFRAVGGDPAAAVHVASGATPAEFLTATLERSAADTMLTTPRRLEFEPLRNGSYVLRLQPELLRSGRYTLTLRAVPSLDFPVGGRDTSAIQSVFGAPRDAGRRQHHGVDIFAPRGTPALAAADGVATRVRTTQVGGNVVWLNTDGGVRLYYAHLDSQSVQTGQRVRAGDEIGKVGNTGNARTTSPHLHFGVYVRGAVDPIPFLKEVRTEPVELSVDLDHLGSWARTTADDVDVLAGPDGRADVIGSVLRNTPMRVWGASARWYRVGLPDGVTGYVAGRFTEDATPMRSESIAGASPVRERPAARSPVIEHLNVGAEVPVLGTYGSYLYVRTPGGLTGWLRFD